MPVIFEPANVAFIANNKKLHGHVRLHYWFIGFISRSPV